MSNLTPSGAIHETENFFVQISPMTTEPVKGQMGYGIYNKRTQVREYETNAEHNAIRMCHEAERLLQGALMDPEDKAGKAEREAALVRAQGYMAGGNLFQIDD